MELNQLENIMKEEGDFFEIFYLGLKCYGRRSDLGHWCGYVDLPITHGLYKEYSSGNTDSIHSIYTHGGITYDNVSNNVLSIGFDCNHSGDINVWRLKLKSLMPFDTNETYKNKEYIIEWVKKMSDQINDIYPKHYRNLSRVIKNLSK